MTSPEFEPGDHIRIGADLTRGQIGYGATVISVNDRFIIAKDHEGRVQQHPISQGRFELLAKNQDEQALMQRVLKVIQDESLGDQRNQKDER